MKNIFFLLCLLAFSCGKKNSNIKCVSQGNHLFTPVGLLSPHKPKSFSGYVIFNETALFNSLGEDNKDWNKLCGIYNFYDFRMNKNAFMLVWRPRGNNIELSLYENIDNAIFQHSSTIIKNINEKINYEFIYRDNKYHLWVGGMFLGSQKNPIIYRNVENIYTWFGGNRRAPQDICLLMSEVN